LPFFFDKLIADLDFQHDRIEVPFSYVITLFYFVVEKIYAGVELFVKIEKQRSSRWDHAQLKESDQIPENKEFPSVFFLFLKEVLFKIVLGFV
jgi:hypothetical protein